MDYAAVELSRVFSESADMLTVSEMDTVTKATNLYIELIHLSRYYDEEYKGSNGNMERYRDGELLPLAIEQRRKQIKMINRDIYIYFLKKQRH